MLTDEQLYIIAGGILANSSRTPGPYLPGAYGSNDGKVYDYNGTLVADCFSNENNAGFLSHAANSLSPLLKHIEQQNLEIRRLERTFAHVIEQLDNFPTDVEDWLDLSDPGE